MLVTAAIYWAFTYTDHSHHKQDSVRELLAPLKHVRVWRFSLYYFLVFGGYVALSLWLPKYYIDVFGLPLGQAALLTALFVFPSGIIRAPGGWLSDRRRRTSATTMMVPGWPGSLAGRLARLHADGHSSGT